MGVVYDERLGEFFRWDASDACKELRVMLPRFSDSGIVTLGDVACCGAEILRRDVKGFGKKAEAWIRQLMCRELRDDSFFAHGPARPQVVARFLRVPDDALVIYSPPGFYPYVVGSPDSAGEAFGGASHLRIGHVLEQGGDAYREAMVQYGMPKEVHPAEREGITQRLLNDAEAIIKCALKFREEFVSTA